MHFLSALRILLNVRCSAISIIANSTYQFSAIIIASMEPSFPASHFSLVLQISDARLLEPVLLTIVHNQLLNSFEVYEREHQQRLLLLADSSRLDSCSLKL